jgi:DNA-directed RNA polymerase subunit K/omega
MPPKKVEIKPTVPSQEIKKEVKSEVKSEVKPEVKSEVKHEVKNYGDDAFDFYKNYDASKNKFDPILSIYERANLIGIRATQIENGAPVFVDVPEGLEDVIEIAEMELAQKKLPLIICREGREYWRAADLIDKLS